MRKKLPATYLNQFQKIDSEFPFCTARLNAKAITGIGIGNHWQTTIDNTLANTKKRHRE